MLFIITLFYDLHAHVYSILVYYELHYNNIIAINLYSIKDILKQRFKFDCLFDFI